MNQLKFWLLLMVSYLSISSWFLNTWISIWMVMEMLVLFFMGLLSQGSGYTSSALMIKYYLIQLLVSLTFLALSLLCLFNFLLEAEVGCALMMLAKLGAAPFHYWVISIVGKMDWLSFYIMGTFMKLPPLSLLYFMFESLNLGSVVIASVLVSTWLGLNNTSVQKMLVYSSLSHFCWFLLSLGISTYLYWLYFMSYSIMMGLLVFLFDHTYVFYINQFKLSLVSKFYNFVIFFIILSFSGFPPFLGFLIKWIVSTFVIYLSMKFMLFLLLLCSVLSTMFYFQMFFYFLLVQSIQLKWYSSWFLSKLSFFLSLLILNSYFFVYFCV